MTTRMPGSEDLDLEDLYMCVEKIGPFVQCGTKVRHQVVPRLSRVIELSSQKHVILELLNLLHWSCWL